MSTGDDDRTDTLLDRMEYIAEVEEEDDDAFKIGEEDDDESMEVDGMFGRDSPDGGSDDDSENYDGDEATPLEYHWTPNLGEEGSDSNSFSSDFQVSGLSLGEITPQTTSIIFDGGASTGNSSDDSHSSAVRFQMSASKRGSFTAPGQLSSTRYSFGSTQSAPTTRELSPTPTKSAQRRVTISVPNSDERGDGDDKMHSSRSGRSSRQQSKRRKSVSLKSMSNAAAGAAAVAESEESSTTSSRGGFLSRKSTKRTSGYAVSVGSKKSSSGSSVYDSMDQAISTLGQGGNSEWENVAAAAAVVAAGTAGSGKRSHTQFAVDEKVLVFLNILNHTNSVDAIDAFTVNPVNKFGYPRGEGKTSEEQHGPYVYVLALVKKVHFDEDLRYYTVARADSGAEQRADTGEGNNSVW
jgi:hypothetical protein